MSILLEKYKVVHMVATTYHPQGNSQAKMFNREIKQILQKVVHPNRKDLSRLLEDAFWAHRTIYQAPLGMSPYRIVCHLPVGIEHRAYWVVKKCNMAFDQAGTRKESFNCQNLRGFTWKPLRTPKFRKKR
ncbi:hypothetical protein CR513_46618, partial [Mucuna pruriens]